MSVALAMTLHDDAAELIRQHGGNPEAALSACLREIDRPGLALEQATYSNSYGYAWGRIRNPGLVRTAAGGRREILDV